MKFITVKVYTVEKGRKIKNYKNYGQISTTGRPLVRFKTKRWDEIAATIIDFSSISLYMG